MRKTVLTACIAAALLGGVTPALAAPIEPQVVVPGRYLNQKINWKPCFDPNNPPPGLPPGSERLECGSFSSPRNWNRPEEKIDITIAASRLRPATGEPKGTVLTNPGGPGGAGRTLPLLFLQAGRTKLVNSMEIVGIDVRGTGDSSNVSCGNFNAPALDPRDRSEGNLELLLDSTELLAKFCQVKSGEFGKYVNTEQTVKDLDLLRHLLGRDKVNWIGYSGGSWLGAFYATYFPRRVDKFVLDSNAEFTAPWQTVSNNQPAGFERRFRQDFLPWVARFDGNFHLGTTGEAVRGSYERVRAKLTERPVQPPEVNPIDATMLDLALILTLYSKNTFPLGAQYLAALRVVVDHPVGEPPTPEVRQALQQLTQLSKLLEQVLAGLNADEAAATQLSIVCNDTPWQGDRNTLVRDSERSGQRYPLTGYYQISQPCVFWKRPNLRLKTPTGQGVPPVLMVQSVRDPATPLEGAQRAHRRFAGSRLLTVTNEGDHGIYASGNSCVDNVVESYLIDAKVPPADLSCPGLPLPDLNVADTTPRSPLSEIERLRRAAGPMPR